MWVMLMNGKTMGTSQKELSEELVSKLTTLRGVSDIAADNRVATRRGSHKGRRRSEQT